MNYTLIPIISLAGNCNVPDPFLLDLWYRMCREGKEKVVFYDGFVSNGDQWLEFVKSPFNYPVVVVNEDKEPEAIAWLNTYENHSARCHHCFLRPFKRGVGEAIINYWRSMTDSTGGPLLLTILGVTPEVNEKAVRLVKLMGFTVLGTIPNFCKLKYENKLVGGVISYICPQGG